MATNAADEAQPRPSERPSQRPPPRTFDGAVAGSGTIAMIVVRTFVEALAIAGVSRREFLQRSGLADEDLGALDARIPEAEAARLLELAVECAGDPLLWLHWAERQSDRAFGPVAPLIAHAATLREGLALLERFSRLLADRTGFAVVEDECAVRIVVERAPVRSDTLNRYMDEMVLGGLHRVVRSFGAGDQLRAVSFVSTPPSGVEEYDRYFGVPVRFGATDSSLVYGPSLLDTPSPHRDDGLREALEALAERRLVQLDDHAPYAARVRVVLTESLTPNRVGMASVARTLGLSVRSLRRRLEEEGVSYDELAREAVVAVAKRLLRDTSRTIQEVAYDMGFSDPTAFHRAFKRWSGTTPGAYKDANRG